MTEARHRQGAVVTMTGSVTMTTKRQREALTASLHSGEVPSPRPNAKRDEIGVAGRLAHMTVDALGSMFAVDVWESEEYWQTYYDHMAQPRAAAGIRSRSAVYRFVDSHREQTATDFLRGLPPVRRSAADRTKPTQGAVLAVTRYPILTARQRADLDKRLTDALAAPGNLPHSVLQLPLTSPEGDILVDVYPSIEAWREDNHSVEEVWTDISVADVDVHVYRFLGRSYELEVDRMVASRSASQSV